MDGRSKGRHRGFDALPGATAKRRSTPDRELHIMCCMLKPIIRISVAIAICTAGVQARVVRILVEQRDSPAFQGRTFGTAGAYEILRGRFYGEIDPKDPHNRIITDLQFAPRNARGMVEYF